jgi:phosphoglycolate phosphatase-like HAD superfamily hydrolase
LTADRERPHNGQIRLALFDIDGTLIRGGPALRGWFKQSLIDVFGRAGRLDSYDFSGKTDPQIVTELMEEAGLERNDIETRLHEFRQVYLERLGQNLDAESLELLPEVREVLGRLDESGVELGLLTGNWEGGARIKLSCFDLNRFFGFGAFGDGHFDRRSLPPVALQNAASARGIRFTVDETVIIGDSRLDVECARHHGIRSVAVATGWASRADLESAGATWVLSDLREAEVVDGLFPN